MDIALALKVVTGFIFIIILMRTLAPNIGDFFNNMLYGTKKKKNSEVDFDIMIEQKKAILSRGETSADSQALASQRARPAGVFESAIHNEFKQLSKSNKKSPRLEEIKELMAIIDSLQWGGGGALKKMSSQLSQKFGVRIEDSKIAKNFKFLAKKEIFNINDQKAHDFSTIKKRLEAYTFLNELVSNENFRSKLAKKFSTSESNFKKAFYVFMQKQSKKKNENLYNEVFKKVNISLPSAESASLILIVRQNTMSDINALLKEEVSFFNTLSPLPALKGNNDVKTAQKIFELPDKFSKENVKKKYKVLARLKHPDRLKGKGIPQKFESIATENFTQIQKAYDILLKNTK